MRQNGNRGNHAAGPEGKRPSAQPTALQRASRQAPFPAGAFPATGSSVTQSGSDPACGPAPEATKCKRSVLPNVAIAFVFVLGLCILLYPTVSNLYNQWRQDQLVSEYDEAVGRMSQEDYSAVKEAARAYNASLSPAFTDAFSGEGLSSTDEYWQLLNITGNGIMGYIEIPKIQVNLPIYHGTGEEELAHGIGHLYGTSLPVGGVGSHCVLSGHRGLPSALLFTDLDQLAEGDRFGLHVLGETLAYEVDQILVVDPDDVSSLAPQTDGDYVTLVTCTPYGVNTQRLLVRGHRVDSMGDAGSVTFSGQMLRSLDLWRELLLAGVAVAALCVAVMAKKKNRAYERRR